VSGAVSAAYTYNGDGLRASKTVGGTTTAFTYDTNGQVPLLLTDGTNDYVYGPTGTPVEQFSPGGSSPQYYFSDTHGSTVELSSSAGSVDSTYAYNAWGKTTAHTGTASTAIEYAAAYVDAETGLLYLQDRYYDPSTAVFISVDPLVANTLAAYLYAGDNPLNALDPLGLWSWNDTWDVVGIVGATLGIVVLTLTVVGSPGDVAGVAADAALGTDLAANLAIEGGEAAETTADVADAASTTSKLAQTTKILTNAQRGIDAAQCLHDVSIAGCSGIASDGLGAAGDAAAKNVPGVDGLRIKAITDFGLGGATTAAGADDGITDAEDLAGRLANNC
jgi:RHS repeat-associated protein